MSHLPAQEPEAGTYFAYDLMKDLIEINHSGNAESMTSEIWITLLTYKFPMTEGYSLTAEPILKDGKADLLNIHTRRARTVGGPRHHRVKFFVVEAKEASLESQSSTWTEARLQTLRYIRSNNQQSDVLYGAVAVGNWVRFYRYDVVNDELHDIYSQERDGPLYHIGRQCSSVDQALQLIKDDDH